MADKKFLYLLRHAKSSWDIPGIRDKDRPLKNRGIRQIAEIGQRLECMGIRPNRVISSPAKRALVTACGIADAINFPSKNIEIDDELYFCGPSTIQKLLSRQDDSCQSIMLVGHNPDLSSLLSSLCGRQEQMPTCAFAAIQLKEKSWAKISKGGKLEAYEFPIKSVKGDEEKIFA